MNRGFTSHSTQSRSFRKRSSQPNCWISTEKLKQTQQKQTCIHKIYNNIKLTQKTKARFSRLLQHPTWKRRRPILVLALHEFVTTYLLRHILIAAVPTRGGCLTFLIDITSCWKAVRNWQVLLSDWQTWPSWWHTPHASASRTSANSRLVDAICGNSVANVWSRATVRRTAANSLGTATENYTHRQLVAHDRQNQQRVDNSKSQHHNHFWGEIWSASSFSVLFCASVLEKTHTYKWCRFLTSRLVAWLSGRMSVFGRRTFSVLRSTCSWRVTTYVGKPSAMGQPPSGWRHPVNAYEGKAGMVYLQVKLCDPCLSALRYK